MKIKTTDDRVVEKSDKLINVHAMVPLFLLDIFSFYVTLSYAIALRALAGFYLDFVPIFKQDPVYFISLWWIPVIFIFFIAHEGLYTKRLVFWHEARLQVKVLTLSIIVAFTIVTLGKMHRMSRLTLLSLWANSLWIFPLFRLAIKNLFTTLRLGIENVIIVGAGGTGHEVARLISNDNYLGYRIKGFLDDDPDLVGKWVKVGNKEYPVLARLSQHRRVIKQFDVSTVIIAIPSISRRKILNLNNTIQHHAKRVLFVRDLKGIGMLNIENYQLFMEPLLMLDIKNNLKVPFNIFLKRTLDITISLFLLPILLLSTVIIGCLVRLTSEGPVFYLHKRIGYRGKEIKICKFRTMYSDAEERLEKILRSKPSIKKEWENSFKIKDDPRVTKIGRFLRKWSLDELPQIFNVLKGDLSLVGPRPVVKEEIRRYYKASEVYYFMVKPGVTGMWQVSGRSTASYDTRIGNDTWYALNWSLWADLVILFKTAKIVLEQKGAY